ncbi:response regulator [Desulfopila aestuarii]|uniref:Two-component system, OmpR family, response regulator n=1 Tax=Desulfopila aestuarii DSM 18488 TaxID=1121416 RepID=A0A1M7Y6C0_9BACT|nr:response regulator transcription factor [Desulfopila aestuarii]SHO48197.1 two-component system, OmpR family, response regulator [Desulfopila aestuarii DSM 18488]
MRILLIEDDKKIAGFIEKGLRESGFVVDTCHDGTEGLELGVQGVHDAAVVDIMLPGMDGLQVIERMRKVGVDTPVLILSARQSVDDRIQGLQRGGDDYMIKPFSFSELLARIQALIRRDKKSTQPTVLKVADLEMDLLKHEVVRGIEKIELPAKEYALLELMLRNSGAVLSKTTILEKVYDYNFDPQTNVVDVLVCRLRNKIDKDYDRKLIQTVRGMGYVLRGD